MATIDETQIQGLVKRGYGKLPFTTALIVSFPSPEAGRAWLREIRPQICAAADPTGDSATHVALTHGGLTKLGKPTAFPLEFVDGPTAERTARALGDLGPAAAEHWQWGGPNTPPVDALLLLYSADETRHLHRVAAEKERLGEASVGQIDSLGLEEKDHFGFMDGLSQPVIDGFAGGPPRDVSPDDCLTPGEFVLGYANEYGKVEDVQFNGRPFGKDGSYLVVRQLAQDVPTFWQELANAAPKAGLTPLELATQIVGREPEGRPLALPNDQPYQSGTTPSFSFRNAPFGACPIGAHVFRSHPRDAIPGIDTAKDSIKIGRNHRILRRGRRYGATISPEEALTQPSNFDRGLLFMCLNASIRRQFEFIQQTWLNNPKFGGLYGDVDLIGGSAEGPRTFTVQRDPVNERCLLGGHYVRVVGSAYFFLPSLAALDQLIR